MPLARTSKTANMAVSMSTTFPKIGWNKSIPGFLIMTIERLRIQTTPEAILVLTLLAAVEGLKYSRNRPILPSRLAKRIGARPLIPINSLSFGAGNG